MRTTGEALFAAVVYLATLSSAHPADLPIALVVGLAATWMTGRHRGNRRDEPGIIAFLHAVALGLVSFLPGLWRVVRFGAGSKRMKAELYRRMPESDESPFVAMIESISADQYLVQTEEEGRLLFHRIVSRDARSPEQEGG